MLYPIPPEYVFSPDKARDRGYSEEGSSFTTRKNLAEEGFVAYISIANGFFDVRVVELPDEDDFLPFEVKSNQGAFVAEIKAQVEIAIQKVLQEAFSHNDPKEILLSYMESRYNTVPESPWEMYPDYKTFKTSGKGKWYAVYMEVSRNKVCGGEDDTLIRVINVKINPYKKEKIIDDVHFFEAYHMNKKNWISIVLDAKLDLDRVKKMIDKSYELVEGKA